jgi:hypothetical protein
VWAGNVHDFLFGPYLLSPIGSEEDLTAPITDRWANSKHQAGNWNFLTHMSISAVLFSVLEWGCWQYIWPYALHWYKIQHLQNTSVLSWFPNLVRHTLMVNGTARMHIQHTVAWKLIFVLFPPITSRNLGMEFLAPNIYRVEINQFLNHHTVKTAKNFIKNV